MRIGENTKMNIQTINRTWAQIKKKQQKMEKIQKNEKWEKRDFLKQEVDDNYRESKRFEENISKIKIITKWNKRRTLEQSTWRWRQLKNRKSKGYTN